MYNHAINCVELHPKVLKNHIVGARDRFFGYIQSMCFRSAFFYGLMLPCYVHEVCSYLLVL